MGRTGRSFRIFTSAEETLGWNKKDFLEEKKDGEMKLPVQVRVKNLES
jgi:hypothetical protein